MKSGARSLELNKILEAVSSFAVLEASREKILRTEAETDRLAAQSLLDFTEEASLLLFELGAGAVEYFPPLGDKAERAEKGAALSCGELLELSKLMRSARVCRKSVNGFSDGRTSKMRALTEMLTEDGRLEEEIAQKILGEDEISDRASDRLYALRREIRLTGEKIRARLAAYLTGEEKKFLQDGIVTVRGDRYVIPVKAEYKRSVKGFIHDRSATGSTVYIEPEEVLEMNNELRSLMLDEREEQNRILSELSRAVGARRAEWERDEEILCEADCCYARAAYAYSLKARKPALSAKGIVEIVRGKHPLLDMKTAVPVSVSVGADYDFLIISGANTGGKTVTLKMCGLFCLMAACGLFVPAEHACLGVFREIFCDVGDSQSIEENLSTFSSHLLNLKEITERAGKESFVLIDEPGGGTDPEEGQALARAILNALLKKGCRGIVTTHYSALKEFAAETPRMENGCMEFDAADYRPLYRLKIGAPGSSNALAVCVRLGLPQELIAEARSYLSEGARAFESAVRAAEESRVRADEIRAEAELARAEVHKRLSELERDEEKFRAERERFTRSAKIEARRIVNEHTARAEELLEEIEEIFKKETFSQADLIRARTLKNQLLRAETEEDEPPVRLTPVDPKTLKAGERVFVKSMGAEGEVLSLKKNGAEVRCGAIRVICAFSDLFQTAYKRQAQEGGVRVVKNLQPQRSALTECNVIGQSTDDALPLVDTFLDGAVLAGLERVRVVHGMGTGRLRSAIHAFLRKDPRVREFRLGVYGEGESGVTIVTLK